MTIEIKVPTLGESVSEATVGKWFKQKGDPVAQDEVLVELETDKVTVEVPAPSAGVLHDILAAEGDQVGLDAVLAVLTPGEGAPAVKAAPAAATEAPKPEAAPAAATEAPQPEAAPKPAAPAPSGLAMPPAPAAAKKLAEAGMQADEVAGSGKRGQVLKHDVIDALAARATAPKPAPAAADVLPTTAAVATAPATGEERVRMTRLRQTIAQRLKDAQNTAAMLTTFNDVDMSAIVALRKQYKDMFEKRYGVRLGFLGFFVKAIVGALKEIPAVNAEIDGADIVYKNYYHIGVAVGTDKGLVVPVVRDADQKSIAEIEADITGFAKKAREGKLGIEDMQGGTFTLTNGGVYGSLLSTPILNMPQSGILGMHRTEDRPVALNGEVVIRPMMYLALSYDHRIIDGREAVTFLVHVKNSLEDPQRLLLAV